MSNFLANVDHFHSLINGGTFKRTGKHEFINEREEGEREREGLFEETDRVGTRIA